jgi:hypothetical protein
VFFQLQLSADTGKSAPTLQALYRGEKATGKGFEQASAYSTTPSQQWVSFVLTFPTLPHPSFQPRVLINTFHSLEAQINHIQDFLADPDCIAIPIRNKLFNFTLYNIYNENDQQCSPNRTIERKG